MFNLTRFQIPMVCLVLLFTACGNSEKKVEAKEKPMVYEGMPSTELENAIGNPDRIDSSGTVFDANTGKTKKVEKWYYSKRTVVIINDTVITPNLSLPD